MRRLFAILILVSICFLSYSQKLRLSLAPGYGFYQLTSLKDFQTALLENLSFPLEKMEQFPNYLNSSISAEYYLSKSTLIGIDFAYYTTGARNDLKDYSGEIRQDMLINGYRIGIQVREILVSHDKIDFYCLLRSGLILSKFKIIYYNVIGNNTPFSLSSLFSSTTFFAEPVAGGTYKLTDKFLIDFSIGYEVDKGSTLYFKGHKPMISPLMGRNVILDYSGIRVRLGVSFDLF